MNSITQHILQNGIPEDIFILILAIPIIFALITFFRRVIGSITLGIFTPLFLTLLMTIIDLKDSVTLFVFIFVSMLIIRYFLRKIPLLSMTDTRVLDAVMFCVLTIIIILGLLYLPLVKNIQLNIAALFLLLVMSSCSQDLITMWEFRGFKRFISPFIEFLTLIIVSYLLITWGWIQNAILEYPLVIIVASITIIILLAKWGKLKLKEHIRYGRVIKHVELPEKK